MVRLQGKENHCTIPTKGGSDSGLSEFDIAPYGELKKYPGDDLTGHELLQNAWKTRQFAIDNGF